MIAIGSALMVVGAIGVALFVYINLYVQPKWFPDIVASQSGAKSGAGSAPGSHRLVGVMLAALVFGGIIVFSLGAAMVATTIGYGHA